MRSLSFCLQKASVKTPGQIVCLNTSSMPVTPPLNEITAGISETAVGVECVSLVVADSAP